VTGRRSTINLMNRSNPFTLQGGLTCLLNLPTGSKFVAQALVVEPLLRSALWWERKDSNLQSHRHLILAINLRFELSIYKFETLDYLM
jgi:hypothetical protein